MNAFTAVVSEHASTIAAEALAGIDLEAIVAEALSAVEESGALASAQGIAANGAWASNDPEHMATYGLMADYALGTVLDSLDEAEDSRDAADTADQEAAPEATQPRAD